MSGVVRCCCCTEGTLGDGVGIRVEKEGIGCREIFCLFGRRGGGKHGEYMLVKTCASCLGTACCALPTMLSGVGWLWGKEGLQ